MTRVITILLALFSPLAALAQAQTSLAPRVRFETTAGNFLVELDTVRAPLTAENFLRYVRDGGYDGTVFHRVIANFVIQGGGYDDRLAARTPQAPIPNESWQRSLEPPGNARPRTRRLAAFRQLAVLHQPRRQRGTRPVAEPLGLRCVRPRRRRHGRRRSHRLPAHGNRRIVRTGCPGRAAAGPEGLRRRGQCGGRARDPAARGSEGGTRAVTVWFASDLHLDPSTPEIAARFHRFLDGPVQGARSLFLLGDLFEAWIGDDDPEPATVK